MKIKHILGEAEDQSELQKSLFPKPKFDTADEETAEIDHEEDQEVQDELRHDDQEDDEEDSEESSDAVKEFKKQASKVAPGVYALSDNKHPGAWGEDVPAYKKAIDDLLEEYPIEGKIPSDPVIAYYLWDDKTKTLSVWFINQRERQMVHDSGGDISKQTNHIINQLWELGDKWIDSDYDPTITTKINKLMKHSRYNGEPFKYNPTPVDKERIQFKKYLMGKGKYDSSLKYDNFQLHPDYNEFVNSRKTDIIKKRHG
jgi:hypothetical protein